MPYIGRGPSKSGSFRIIDDISSSFNGSTTAFTLQVNSSNLTIGQEQTLLISLDGVMQEPKSAYTISGSTITFASAPATGVSFWGVELGDVGGIADAVTSNAITGRTDLGAAPATGDTLLVYDTSASSLKEMTVANLFTSPAIAGGTFSGSFTGTMDITGTVLSGASPLVFEGASADCHETTLAFTDPTADRTITFPNDTGTVSLTGATETLAAKTLTTPTIASTGWTNATHAHSANNSGGTLNAAAVGAGTVATARLGSGTANCGVFLRGDQTWAAAGGTTINNNADNRLITGSGSADTLEGEQYLTYTGGSLEVSIASGDPKVLFDIGGTNEWFVGVDDSADDALKIGTGGTVGANCAIIFGTDGNVYLGCAANTSFSFGGKRGSNLHTGSVASPSLAFASDSNTGIYRVAADQLGIVAGGAMQWTIQNGPTFFNDTASSKVGKGVVLNMGCSNDFILDFQSAKVAHGVTGSAETDTFSFFRKYGNCTGGIEWMSFAEAAISVQIHGIGTNQNTEKAYNAPGTIILNAGKANGTAIASLGADGNLVSINDHGHGVRFIFDVEGTFHADVASTTFDNYCDVELMRGVLAETVPCYKQSYQDRFGKDLMYDLPWYEENKLIGKNSIHWEERECGRVQQRAMINFTGLTMLHHSTIIQLADRVDARLTALENQIALQGGK